jgi:hypothetical protein
LEALGSVVGDWKDVIHARMRAWDGLGVEKLGGLR